MKFTREKSADVTIRSITRGSVRIGDKEFRRNIAITPNEVLEEAPASPVENLTIDDLRPLLDKKPDIIVLGTGDASLFAPREIFFGLARIGVGLEVMSSAAAARTFNVLAGEQRRVAALIYV